MLDMIILLAKICGAVVVGIFAGHAAVYIFNKIPAQWLCDYGQKPDEALENPYQQRVKGVPWKWVFSGFFMAGGIRLVIEDWAFAAAAVVFCWALLEIGLADKKYGIIPDQFVILTAISALGFIPFHSSFLQPRGGMLLGGGVMLASALIGKLILKKETLGFGDVKLFAAAGLALGFRGTLWVLVLSAVGSAVIFSVLLLMRKIKKEDMVPLGPYICGAGIFYVVIVWPLLVKM